MNDLMLASALLFITLVIEFFLYRRLSYLKSDEAHSRFNDSELKNGKRLIWIYLSAGILLIPLFAYRVIIAL